MDMHCNSCTCLHVCNCGIYRIGTYGDDSAYSGKTFLVDPSCSELIRIDHEAARDKYSEYHSLEECGKYVKVPFPSEVAKNGK